jgi:transglutaminase-like putative cysteine protease
VPQEASRSPQEPQQVLERGTVLVGEGRIDEALELYGRLARDFPRSESPRLAAGNALLGAGRVHEALREFEAAARLAPKPAYLLNGLARLYLDSRVRRPADALNASRAARRLEPWREESYYLQARAHEGLGDQASARQAYRILLTNFPNGDFSEDARRGLDQLSRVAYEVQLNFRFENRGHERARKVRFRVQAAQDFPPYSEARLLQLPEEATGKSLAEGTRYFSFEPFDLDPGEVRTQTIRYAVAVSAAAYAGLGATTSAIQETSPAESPQRFLTAGPFIESDSPEIVSLSRTLAPPDSPARERARRFYDFVVKRLSYVVQLETQGALGALANPTQADCTEFASLFIALSRAAGIPSRPVFGYLYEPAKSSYEISHLWAEFWEEGNGWVTTDPTNGTLEPDRYFARVESSSIPLWVPSPAFGDLAGVRVSYESKGTGDPLFTELVAEIRPLSLAAFDSLQTHEPTFASAGGDEVDPTRANMPVVPAAALVVAALGLGLWQKRTRLP